MKEIRLGLVGCGQMMDTHAKCVNGSSTKLNITACCDIILENAQRVADALGTDAYVTTDWKTMVDYVDAVLIALPHDLHYECGVFFARHKKHVLMEKPLCNTEEECLSLMSICKEEGVVLMCAYPLRYEDPIVKLKELVDSGKYGRVMQMSIWTEQLTRLEEGSWGSSARLGGGQLFSHGCHYVDVLLWFLGDPVGAAHFGTKIGTPWMMREGTSALIMKFKNGALGYHGATWGARGTRLGYDFQIQMEKGMLEYDGRAKQIKFYNGEKDHIPGQDTTIITQDYEVIEDYEGGKMTQNEILHFIDCVETGKRPLTDGYATLQGLRVIWKTYEAEKSGQFADISGLGLDEGREDCAEA